MKYAHLLLAIMLLGMWSSMAYADVPPPPPGGYAGGVFSQYFKNIADSSLWGSSNWLCPSGYGVVGFRSNSDSTFATPICNSVGMAGWAEWQTFVFSGGTWRGTSNIFHKNGNVGIGTIDPLGTLQIWQSTNVWWSNPEAEILRLKIGNVGHSWNGGGFDIFERDNANFAHLDFRYWANLMTLRSDGNIGIWTQNPWVKLDVNGGINIVNNNNLTWWGAYGPGIPTIAGSTSNGGFLNFYPGWSTSSVTLAMLSNGNVGIWTISPQKRLDVLGWSNDFVTVWANTLGVWQWSGIHFGYRENNNLYRKSAIVFERTDNSWWGGNAAGKIHILNWPALGWNSATLADARLTIWETGNVGIGTTSPWSPLEVSSTADGILRLRQKESWNVWNYIEFYNNSARQWYAGTDSSWQFVIGKDWWAWITVIEGQLKITGGSPLPGKVLTSDANGLATWTTPTSTTWYDGWVWNPGYDANTILPSKSWFSYSNNTPHTGPLVHFDAWWVNWYGLQLSADYSGWWRGMSFRTRNGDAGVWNGWNRVLTDAWNTVWSVNQFWSNKWVSSYLWSNNTYGLQAFSNDWGAAAMSFHRGWYYAVNMGLDPDNVFRIGGWSAAANRWQLDMAGNQTVAGFMRAGSYLYTDQNYGYGLVGVYASTRYQWVYAMGDAYKLAPDGITPGNLYGIAWTHENVGWESKAWLGHQALFMMNGSTYTAIGNGIWTQGKITSLGTITAPGYLYSSDRSLKKDITPLSQSLENIKKLNGYSFAWKKGGRKDIWVIAQEVEKVFPDIVHMDTTGTRSVEYGNLVAPLIESTKELANMHDAQEKRIQAQQQEIAELRQELAELRRLIEKK